MLTTYQTYNTTPVTYRKVKPKIESSHIALNSIYTDDIRYKLNESITYSISKEESDFIIRCEKFDITVWGETEDEAKEAFGFAFDALYKCYALESDENLTAGAIELKKSLLSIVQNYEAQKS